MPSDKVGAERTSALMYFLALDATLKKQSGVNVLDCDPNKYIGKKNRDLIKTEYVNLVQVSNINGIPTHIKNLGGVEEGGTSPEKRISSNFLTVSLKNSTTKATPSFYPKRPKNYPLMKLGREATGIAWGVKHFEDFQLSVPFFLSDRISTTPFHDLAILVLRNINGDKLILYDALIDGLEKLFTKPLFDFWRTSMKFEKMIFQTPPDAFQSTVSRVFNNDLDWLLTEHNVGVRDEAISLKRRVKYLEELLIENKIDFKYTE